MANIVIDDIEYSRYQALVDILGEEGHKLMADYVIQGNYIIQSADMYIIGDLEGLENKVKGIRDSNKEYNLHSSILVVTNKKIKDQRVKDMINKYDLLITNEDNLMEAIYENLPKDI